MELQKAITTRRSIRAFTDQEIPREDLIAIVDAGRLAPTGSNRQPWDFVVITEPETIAEIAKAAEWIGQAKAIIAIVLDEFSPVWKDDGCSAATTMLLKIVDLGYGATWVQGNIANSSSSSRLCSTCQRISICPSCCRSASRRKRRRRRSGHWTRSSTGRDSSHKYTHNSTTSSIACRQIGKTCALTR